MTNDQFDEFKNHIETVIQAKVNGKIDGMSRKLDSFIERADPAVKFFENLTWLRQVVISLVVFMASLATAWVWLSGFIKK